MEQIFVQLGIILLAAFVVAYFLRLFKQPLIIGYIIAGVILSSFFIKVGASNEIINVLSQFGVAFLLFIVGLHLNPKIIKEIGISSLFLGLIQIIITFGLSFLIAFKLLGFDTIASCYIGLALAFSSTIIIMKLLSDNQQLDSLFGKISIGVLIVQDLVAVAALIIISSVSGGLKSFDFNIEGILIGLGLIIGLFLIGYFALPKFTKKIAKSQELLFLFSICWCFIVGAIFSFIGFSVEIGALIAGVILSISPYATEISAKIKPLRDFFVIVFFIILGSKIQLSNFWKIIVNALIFSGIALILKPIILMWSMKLFNYTKRTNFLVGVTLSQISEFSIIVISLGITLNHLSQEIFDTIILTLIFTILISSYLIIYSNQIYYRVSNFLNLFEKKSVRKKYENRLLKKEYEIILFGYNRIGFSILNSLRRMKKDYLIVDFNPEVINNLEKFGVPALYGDAFDLELLGDLPLDKSKIIISTIPDVETNDLLMERVREINKNAIVILRAHTIEDALHLYEEGASYVLTPHFLGGEYVAKMIEDSGIKIKDYESEKKKHIKMLIDAKEKGHRHPNIEKN